MAYIRPHKYPQFCCKEVHRRFTVRGRLGFLSSELLQNCLSLKKIKICIFGIKKKEVLKHFVMTTSSASLEHTRGSHFSYIHSPGPVPWLRAQVSDIQFSLLLCPKAGGIILF